MKGYENIGDYFRPSLGDEDVAKFKAYAIYKLELNKISTQAGYPKTIDWPIAPV
jgi:hypothetical protein